MTDPSSIAQLSVDALRLLGIETLFCLPGVQNDPFFDRLVDAPDIRPIVTRHEQGAAYMALGASQVTGGPAACAVVPGPGLLNAGAALTSAYWAGGRVLAIVGAIADFQKGRHIGVLHELPDSAAVIGQLSKHHAYLDEPTEAVERIQHALNQVVSGVPRPVVIEVPANRWSGESSGQLTAPRPSYPSPDPAAVEEAAVALSGAERPLIVVGGGALDAAVEVRALVERLKAPVFTRRQGHGVVDARHPLWCPITVGREFWRHADVVVGVGTRMEFPITHWGVDDDLQIIQVNVDESELDRHGIDTIGLHGDAAPTVQALLDTLDGVQTRSGDQTAAVARRRAEFDRSTAHLGVQRELLGAVRRAVPDNGIIVEDVTQLGFAAHLLFEFRHPRTFLTSGPAGTLGAAVAQSIGAQVAAGDRPVVALIGDGGFLFTATELATAVQHDIPVTIVLHDNKAYGNVRTIQRERFGPDRTIASDLRNPDFVAFVQSFGARAEQAAGSADLEMTLRDAIDHAGPSVVVVETGDVPSPWSHLMMGRVRGERAMGPGR